MDNFYELVEKITESLDGVLGKGAWELTNTTHDCLYSEKLESGKYELRHDGEDKPVASFQLHPMINCCGICVSTQAFVMDAYRNQGLNTLLNSLRIDMARHLGYSLLLCTDVVNNSPQRRVLKKNGWRDIYKFVNRRTSNTVAISVINL
jgi:GNAT superfamily N-acetyltransferase